MIHDGAGEPGAPICGNGPYSPILISGLDLIWYTETLKVRLVRYDDHSESPVYDRSFYVVFYPMGSWLLYDVDVNESYRYMTQRAQAPSLSILQPVITKLSPFPRPRPRCTGRRMCMYLSHQRRVLCTDTRWGCSIILRSKASFC